MACTSGCNTALPLLLGRLVDGVKAGTDLSLGHVAAYRFAAEILGALAVVYVVREALNVWRRSLVENACTQVNRDMSVRALSHLMKGDLGKLHQNRVGALHGRIFRSVDGFVTFLRVGFLDFLPAVLTGIFAIVAAVAKQPYLGLCVLGVVPTTIYLTVRQLRSQKGVRIQLARSCEEIDATVIEILSGLEYIRAADTHGLEVRRLAGACERRRVKEIGHHFQMSLFGAAKALNEGFFHIVVLGTAIYFAVQETISYGDVLTFSILFLNIMGPLSEVHRVLDRGHEASIQVGDLVAILRHPVDSSFAQPADGQPRLVPGEPVVEVEDLRVDYVTADGQLRRALDGLSLSIRYGETVGVAGRSGGGKSTWLKVLLRLTHPSGGSARLGGVPLEACSRETIGHLIGYVGQQPFIFAGTVADNIAYGNPEATPDAIRHAAELAAVHDEIMLMPDGYATLVAERGQNLSGGQRQRLALARILLRQPPILILDEATSALDNISERWVQRSLGLTGTDRTTILVAHRLTTLKDADRIVVFDDGRIVEMGTYAELVQRGGKFTELVLSGEHGSESPHSTQMPQPDAAVEAG
jgi:ATP-binding cassette subfamily B protein